MSESPSQSQSNALPPQLPRPTFTTTEDPLAGESDVLVIGLPESGELSPAGETVDRALGGVLTALIERGQLTGETGELFT